LAKNPYHFILLIITNLLVILFVIELGLRVYSSFFIVYDLEMHKYAIELKRISNTSGLIHEHIPNAKAKLMNVGFNINSMGFRDDEISLGKNPDQYRIMVLGCSNTVGWGVEQENVFTALIEKKLNKTKFPVEYQVINAGVGNYNTLLESIQIKDRIQHLDPNMVILHYYINDAEIILNEDVGLFIRSSYLFAFLKNRLKYHKFKREYQNLGSYYLQLYETDSEGWLSAQNAFLDIKEICRKNDAILLVALQPDLHNISRESGQHKCHKIITSFLSDHKISYLDLIDSYRTNVKEDIKSLWVHPNDAHPNIEGHRIIFEALSPVLDSILHKFQ